MFDTDLDTDLSAEELAERADEVHQAIGRAIAALPGVDTGTIARACYTKLSEELRESLGGDEGEQLTELTTLVAVEQTTRRVDE